MKKNNGFYIATKYRKITCSVFDDSKSLAENIIAEKEITQSKCKILKTEKEFEFYGPDDIQWYDIMNLGIARAVRDTKKI